MGLFLNVRSTYPIPNTGYEIGNTKYPMYISNILDIFGIIY
jgi:hypothetical protein